MIATYQILRFIKALGLVVSNKIFFILFPNSSQCKTGDPLGILAKRHILNKLGRGPLDDATYQIPRLLTSDSKIFSFYLDILFLPV